MQIGRKIYYEKNNGVVIWDKGEMEGDVVETTLEQDMEVMPVLTLIAPEHLGVKQLTFGELSDSFAICRGYRINPDTEEVEFVTQ
ncbi:MAG TPA: hypothetical protein DD811_02630 [Syntrophomonas sp.]|jgi:hypothetical protein|nr:hypothetical protein [Syntrophomonas sp.]